MGGPRRSVWLTDEVGRRLAGIVVGVALVALAACGQTPGAAGRHTGHPQPEPSPVTTPVPNGTVVVHLLLTSPSSGPVPDPHGTFVLTSRQGLNVTGNPEGAIYFDMSVPPGYYNEASGIVHDQYDGGPKGDPCQYAGPPAVVKSGQVSSAIVGCGLP